MAVTAYLRVSKESQDLEKNKGDILALANDKNLGRVNFVEEKVTGTLSWRKRLIFNIMQNAVKGDVLIIPELSRLGRSMLEIMEILSIAREKGVFVYSVKGNWQLDDSIQSKLFALFFSMASEIERDLISQRTKEALRARKEAGVVLGRKKGSGSSKLDKYLPEIKAHIAAGANNRRILERLFELHGVSMTESNFSNYVVKKELRPKNNKGNKK